MPSSPNNLKNKLQSKAKIKLDGRKVKIKFHYF